MNFTWGTRTNQLTGADRWVSLHWGPTYTGTGREVHKVLSCRVCDSDKLGFTRIGSRSATLRCADCGKAIVVRVPASAHLVLWPARRGEGVAQA